MGFVHEGSKRACVRNPCASISYTSPLGALVYETHAHLFRTQALLEPSCTKPMRIYFVHKPSWSPRIRNPCASISYTSPLGALVYETHAHLFRTQALLEPSYTKPVRIYFVHKPSW